uniref:Uncharacterized protein n=1 Tax=Knipowitschia caucasica TaxID=637954 RepID=A0AAV2KLR9_KNICA
MTTPRPAMYGQVATPFPHLNQHKREQLSIIESQIFREILCSVFETSALESSASSQRPTAAQVELLHHAQPPAVSLGPGTSGR